MSVADLYIPKMPGSRVSELKHTIFKDEIIVPTSSDTITLEQNSLEYPYRRIFIHNASHRGIRIQLPEMRANERIIIKQISPINGLFLTVLEPSSGDWPLDGREGRSVGNYFDLVALTSSIGSFIANEAPHSAVETYILSFKCGDATSIYEDEFVKIHWKGIGTGVAQPYFNIKAQTALTGGLNYLDSAIEVHRDNTSSASTHHLAHKDTAAITFPTAAIDDQLFSGGSSVDTDLTLTGYGSNCRFSLHTETETFGYSTINTIHCELWCGNAASTDGHIKCVVSVIPEH